MDEIEELTMLLIQADPDNSNQYPFWICEVCNVYQDPASPHCNQVQVCWYQPKRARGKSSTATFTTAQYFNAGFALQVSSSTNKLDKHWKARLKKMRLDWQRLHSGSFRLVLFLYQLKTRTQLVLFRCFFFLVMVWKKKPSHVSLVRVCASPGWSYWPHMAQEIVKLLPKY